jgi:hypothetical protein
LNKIDNITFDKEISFEDMVIENFWEKINSKFNKNKKSDFINDFEKTEEVICLISDEELPSDLINKLYELSEKGVRVYFITNKAYPSYGVTISKNCLIRIISNIKGNMIIFDPFLDQKNKLYIASSGIFSQELSYEWLKINDNNTLKEAYHYFCYNFWKVSEIEFFNNSEKEISYIPSDIPPLINPKSYFFNTYSYPLFSKKIIDMIKKANASIIINSKIIDNINELERLLISKLKDGVKVSLLFDFSEKNAKKFLNSYNDYPIKLYMSSEIMPQFIITDDNNGLVFSDCLSEKNFEGQNNIFAAKISDEEIKICLSKIEENSSLWFYQEKKTLKEIEGLEIFFSISDKTSENIYVKEKIDKPVKLKSNSLQELKEKIVSENQLKILGNKEYSKKIIFKINLSPLYRNEKAKKDELYNNWDKCKEKFLDILEHFKKLLEDEKEKKNKISEIGDKLKKFFLGKTQKLHELSEKLSEIELLIKKIKAESFNEAKKRLKNFEEEFEKNKKQINEAIDENGQEIKWSKRKKELNNEINIFFNDLKDLENEINSLKEEKEKLEIEKEKKYIEINKKINSLKIDKKNFFNKNNLLEKEWEIYNNLKIEIEKMKEKNFKINNLNKIELYLNDLKGNSDYFKNLMRSLYKKEKLDNKNKKILLSYVEDSILKVLKSKYENKKHDITKIEENEKDYSKKIENLEKDFKESFSIISNKIKNKESKIDEKKSSIKNKEDELEKMKIFEYKPIKNSEKYLEKVLNNSKNKLKKQPFIEKSIADISIPQEDLPEIGTLYSWYNDKKKCYERQLAIIYWEDFEIGEKEAQKLNAILTCERS